MSSQIYDLSMGCTPLKWWFGMTNQSGFAGTQLVSIYIGGIAKHVLMLLSMAAEDQPEPINQSKVSAASISYFNLLLSAVLKKLYLWLK